MVTPTSQAGDLTRMRKQKRADIECPTTPACDCETGWSCVATARTKSTCAIVKCVNDSTGTTVANGASGSSSGVNPAVIAGPIVAAVAILAASLAVWWFLRKKKAKDLARLAELEARAKRAEQETLAIGQRSPQPPIPTTLHHRHNSQSNNSTSGGSGASAEHNPNGIPMTQTYPVGRALTPILASHPHDPSSSSSTTAGRTLKVYSSQSINLDPSHPSNRNPSPLSPLGLPQPDPFSDSASVSTSNDGLSFLSQSTNVIPIAYVPSPSYGRPLSTSHSALGGPPNRPLRDPNLDLGIKYGPQHAATTNNNPSSSTNTNITTTRSGVAVPNDASSINSRQSVAHSFLSFNSTNFALDTPTISTVNVGVAQRANLIHLNNGNRPPVPPPSASYASVTTLLPNQKPSPPPNRLTVAKPIAGRSPLSQAATATSPSNEPPSPPPIVTSPAREPHDPFNDANKAHLSVTPATPQAHEEDQTESLVGRHPSDPRYSMADSFHSSVSDQSSVVLGSATIVRVGQEAQSSTLFRSGSVRSVGGSKKKVAVGRASETEQLQRHTEREEEDDSFDKRASAGTTFTTASNGLGSYPFVPPSSDSLPSPRRPNPPFAGGVSQRDTQYSGLSQFDFLPPTDAPDRNWGHGSSPSSGSGAGAKAGTGEARNSLDTLQLVNELKGFPQF